ALAPTTSLAVDAGDGSLLKAAGGLFRSPDRGESWQPLPFPNDINPDQIREVVTTAAAPERLFVAGPGAGVFRSDDRGESWRAVSGELPSQEIGAFAVHSYLPDTLYAWIAGQGVFRTEDGGEEWTLMDEGPSGDGPLLPVLALAHSSYEGSMNTGWLYAATPEGPYLSMDCF
ncbi:MAG: WD40/YVTN/BNR-like repeat-containing protein, partial [Thermomicrobiales bacterium]